VVYRQDSVAAREALPYLERVWTAAHADVLEEQLRLRVGGHPERPRLTAVPLATASGSGRWLSVFVPLVLILMTMTGAVYPAIDLTAGERERGTLEILIAAPIPRISVLLAKYVAVVAVAVLTAVVNLGAMTVSVLLTGLGETLFGPGGISAVTILEIFGLVILFAAFFAAVLLVVTSFARSFKEAQAYLIPLMLVSIAPGLLALAPRLSLNGPLALVPLLNIVLLSRDLLDGQAHPGAAAVVIGATALYAFLAIVLAARLFGAEAVLYSESGIWRYLFPRQRRRALPRPTQTLTSLPEGSDRG
jgi:ABC-type Na+ efflux pump permease subunit